MSNEFGMPVIKCDAVSRMNNVLVPERVNFSLTVHWWKHVNNTATFITLDPLYLTEEKQLILEKTRLSRPRNNFTQTRFENGISA